MVEVKFPLGLPTKSTFPDFVNSVVKKLFITLLFVFIEGLSISEKLRIPSPKDSITFKIPSLSKSKSRLSIIRSLS